ncbi:MAG: CDP-alcohol phosphatidyltransferase family protein, partial [Eggerthellaceae bacterium]|nr:CDP-alcohol phosphatidyltransferase family protein [Eggerthellaceae bacterium]
LTDCVDGYIARATHSVSRLGQILDPAVDRLLMISGAIGLILVGRLPLWIFLLVIFRDAVLLVGGAWLLRTWQVRVPVVYAGKVVTTLLFSGFAFLLINWPIVAGLGWTSLSRLPGFNALPCSVGIWLVYLGLVMGVFTTSYYVIKSVIGLREAKARAVA